MLNFVTSTRRFAAAACAAADDEVSIFGIVLERFRRNRNRKRKLLMRAFDGKVCVDVRLRGRDFVVDVIEGDVGRLLIGEDDL